MWVYGNWRRHATQSSINQTGMDFVTEISFCKTLVVDETRLVFRGWESAREIIYSATTPTKATRENFSQIDQSRLRDETIDFSQSTGKQHKKIQNNNIYSFHVENATVHFSNNFDQINMNLPASCM